MSICIAINMPNRLKNCKAAAYDNNAKCLFYFCAFYDYLLTNGCEKNTTSRKSIIYIIKDWAKCADRHIETNIIFNIYFNINFSSIYILL